MKLHVLSDTKDRTVYLNNRDELYNECGCIEKDGVLLKVDDDCFDDHDCHAGPDSGCEVCNVHFYQK